MQSNRFDSISNGEPDTSATRRFGTKTLRHQLLAESPVELCLVGIVPGPKCPNFSSIWCRSVSYHVFGAEVFWDGAEVSYVGPKCLVAEASGKITIECIDEHASHSFNRSHIALWKRASKIIIQRTNKPISNLTFNVRYTQPLHKAI